MTYFFGACRLFHPTSQVTTTPNLMICTLVEPSVARPTHTGEDCTEPWRELGAAGSGAGVSSRVSRARSPPARLNHFVRNFAEKRVQKNRAPIPSCPEHPNYESGIQTLYFLLAPTPQLVLAPNKSQDLGASAVFDKVGGENRAWRKDRTANHSFLLEIKCVKQPSRLTVLSFFPFAPATHPRHT